MKILEFVRELWDEGGFDEQMYSIEGIAIAEEVAVITGLWGVDADGDGVPEDYGFGAGFDIETGINLWRYDLNYRPFNSIPAIYGELAFFGGQQDKQFIAVNISTGSEYWGRVLEEDDMFFKLGAPIVYSGDLFFIANGLIYSIDSNGNINWWREQDVLSDIIVSNNMMVRGGGNKIPLMGINARTGEVIWETAGSGGYNIVSADNLVFSMYGDLSRVVALNISNGVEAWSTNLPEKIEYGGMAYMNGTLYVSNISTKTLFSINTETRDVISKQFPTRLEYFAIANEIIYACGYSNGDVYALDPNSLKTLQVIETGYSRCHQLAVANGLLYVLGDSGVKIYQ